MGNPDVLQPMKTAAIENDAVTDRDIGQISAKDFLNILDKEGLGAGSLSQVLPEKKKIELYAEPEWTKAIKVKDLIRVLKVEKKKVELEIPVDFDWRVNPLATSARNPQYASSYAAYAGGSAGMPNPDDAYPPKWGPSELRKASLDHRFEVFASQLAQLTVAMQDIKAKIDAVAHR